MSADDTDQEGVDAAEAVSMEGTKSKKGVFLSFVLIAVVSFGAGAGAGVYGWKTLNGPIGALMEEPADQKFLTKAPKVGEGEHEIGRIVVALTSGNVSGSDRARLLIDPVIVYEAPSESVEGHAETEEGDIVKPSPLDSVHTEIRDVFIEYLSQLSEDQVRGSYGMVNLRAELLRRARMVTGNDTPKAVLIRDFLLQ